METYDEYFFIHGRMNRSIRIKFIPILMSTAKMFVSVTFLTECLHAHTTSVWLLAAMYTFMILECIGSMKTLFTSTAAITTFIAMNQTMLIINWTSQKCLTTIGTFVWTFTGMTLPYVIIQIRPNGKFTSASVFSTFKRFYTWNGKSKQFELNTISEVF